MVIMDQKKITLLVKQLAMQMVRESGEFNRIALVPLLTGAMPFAVDLLRELPSDTIILPAMVSSYDGQTSGTLQIKLEPDYRAMADRMVWLVDDVLETGKTLLAMAHAISVNARKDARSVVLISKPNTTGQERFTPTLIGEHVGGHWLVGYGMDGDGELRGLREVRSTAANDPQCPVCKRSTLLYPYCRDAQAFKIRQYHETPHN